MALLQVIAQAAKACDDLAAALFAAAASLSCAKPAARFPFTLFDDVSANRLSVRHLSLAEFGQLACGIQRAEKSLLPLCSFAQFGSLRTPKGSLRHDANVIAVHGIIGDYDAERVSPEDAAGRLSAAGICALVFTTPSHADAAPRWRVLAPTSATMSPADYKRLADCLDASLGGILAPESYRLSQSYFYGRTVGSAPPRCIIVDGKPVDLVAASGATTARASVEPSAEQPSDDPFSDIPTHVFPALAETPESVARVRSALAVLPAAAAYPTWIRYLAALRSLDWACAEDLARDWSETADSYSAAAFDKAWASLRTSRAGASSVTIGTLFRDAKLAGWVAERPPETIGDLSLGRRFAERARGRLLYVRSARRWLHFDGARWAATDGGEEDAEAKAVADSVLQETAEAFTKDPSDARKRDHGLALSIHRNRHRLSAMVAVAQSEPSMSVASPAAFDVDPFLLGVRNGVVDLRTGSLLRAKPSQLISKQAGAAYRPEALSPRWEAFLSDVFNGDASVVAFVQRALGYSITGDVREEVLVFCYGAGRNGKSVFANVVAGVFGDYAVAVGTDLIARRKNDGEAARLKNRLPGARLALANEVGEGESWDDKTIKEIVSRERISARALYGEAFDFLPTHHLWIRGNHQPAVLDSGDGLWRRIVLVPFTRTFPKGGPEDLERRILEAERDGILAWVVRGALAWQREGLRVPSVLGDATQQYRDASDILSQWFADACRRNLAARMRVSDAFDSARRFHLEAGLSPPSRPAFTRRVKRLGLAPVRSNGTDWFPGFSLAEIPGGFDGGGGE